MRVIVLLILALGLSLTSGEARAQSATLAQEAVYSGLVCRNEAVPRAIGASFEIEGERAYEILSFYARFQGGCHDAGSYLALEQVPAIIIGTWTYRGRLLFLTESKRIDTDGTIVVLYGYMFAEAT